MDRMVIVTIGATVAIAAALAVGPWAVIPIAVVALAAGLWSARQDPPIGPVSPKHRGVVRLMAGVVAIAIGVLIPAVDGGELNEFWWTVMAVSLLAGIALAVIGIIHTISDRSRQPDTTTWS